MQIGEVRLVRYPVVLGTLLAAHQQDSIREFQLMTLSGSRDSVPARLVELSHVLGTQYSGDIDRQAMRRDAAYAQGLKEMTLIYPLRPETKQVAMAWRLMMAEVDEFCRSGDMLALAADPLLARVRDWTIWEFVRQADGEPPLPWDGPLEP